VPLNVGQRRGGDPPFRNGCAELGEHDRPGDVPVRGDRQREAGVVVEESEDLDV
jgi:hypothetical protein